MKNNTKTMMKKILFTLLLIVAAPAAPAQNILDALKGLASDAIDKATGGKLTEYALVGEWQYARPGVRIGGDGVGAALGGAVLQSKMEEKLGTMLQKVGIKPGACTFAFDKKNNVEVRVGQKSKKGTYEYAPDSHRIVLKFGSSSLAEFTGKVYLDGTNLQLLFPADKLISLLKTVGSALPSNSAATLLKNFDKMSVGLEFTK